MLNLGTKKHKDRYFDGIDNLDYPGCFAMTELHHGKLTLVFGFQVFCYPAFSVCFCRVPKT